MKVVCIDTKPHKKEWPDFPPLIEGQAYEVIREEQGEYMDGEIVSGWVLKNQVYWVYEKWRFIPLSDIDETEFERNYKKPETIT